MRARIYDAVAGPTPLIASTRTFIAARMVSVDGDDVRHAKADAVADWMSPEGLVARSLGSPARFFPRLL